MPISNVAALALALVGAPPGETWLDTDHAARPPGPAVIRLECAAKGTFHKEYGERGGRAVIAGDGSAFVLQCADGRVLAYSAASGARDLGQQTLFRAAASQGLIPPVPCNWSPGYASALPADCDVIDRVGDMLLTSEGRGAVVQAGRDKPLWRRDSKKHWSLELGLLWPRQGTPREIIAANDEDDASRIEAHPMGRGRVRTIATIPARNFLVEGGEEPNGLAYSAAADLIVAPMGGTFRVGRDMALLRAYTPRGQLRWTTHARLKGSETGIVGEFAVLSVFQGGRYGAMRLVHQPAKTWIIDLASGVPVDVLAGDVIGASANGWRLLLRTSAQEVSWVDWALGPIKIAALRSVNALADAEPGSRGDAVE